LHEEENGNRKSLPLPRLQKGGVAGGYEEMAEGLLRENGKERPHDSPAEQYLFVRSRSGISHGVDQMRKQVFHCYCKDIFFCRVYIS
jgi:hypothetical protein